YAGFEIFTSLTICLATVGIFSLYQSMSEATFWHLVAAAEAFTVLALVYTVLRSRHVATPLMEWVRAGRPAEGAESAWRVAVSLRWKLLGALPVINVITGVVVSGLSSNGPSSLNDLGVDVVVAVAVAFTISLELTVLLTKSLLRPVEDLLAATRRVRRGDLDA